jgi:hypothetical protein
MKRRMVRGAEHIERDDARAPLSLTPQSKENAFRQREAGEITGFISLEQGVQS